MKNRRMGRILPGAFGALLIAMAAGHAGAEEGSPKPGPWALPPAGSCTPTATLRGGPAAEDAAPVTFQTGDVISLERLEAIKRVLPPAIWEQRDKFFFEGMQLEIGPCFRDYAAPQFFQEATQKFRGQAKLREDGGLESYTAGLPFAPDSIDAADSKAGLAWAWNVAERYQAGGMQAQFRVSDMVGLRGRAEPFEGETLLVPHGPPRRSRGRGLHGGQGRIQGLDRGRPDDGALCGARVRVGAVSRPREPFERGPAPTTCTPTFRSGAGCDGSAPATSKASSCPRSASACSRRRRSAASGGGADGGSIGGSIGASGGAGAITPKRTGFEGLVLRPQLYDWTISGVQDLLTPINAVTPSYPEAKEREFGSWGLSFGSDRWDLRRALVLEGRTRLQVGGDQVSRLLLYVDLQTLQPLYSVTYDEHDEIRDVGLFVGRFSGDRPDYPHWPDDPARPVRVIDSAGAELRQPERRWRLAPRVVDRDRHPARRRRHLEAHLDVDALQGALVQAKRAVSRGERRRLPRGEAEGAARVEARSEPILRAYGSGSMISGAPPCSAVSKKWRICSLASVARWGQ